MKLREAVHGFLLARAGNREHDLSPHTIELYRKLLRQFCEAVGDLDIEDVTDLHLAQFMAAVDARDVSGSHRDNFWKALRSFSKWAADELGIDRLGMDLKRPLVVAPEIAPYSEDQVRIILDCCDYAAPAKSFGHYRRRRATALRDRAIILLLLETGIRIGELCRLTIRDVDLDAGEIHVQPYHSSVKSKPRTIPIEKATMKVLWRFRAREREQAEWDDLFFAVTQGGMVSIFRGLRERTRIADLHAHGFRHTFAIEYLRNGGDVFTLQRLLGHTDLTMTQRYLAIAKSDIRAAHRRASPVEKWRL